jgi:hypothetical protein
MRGRFDQPFNIGTIAEYIFLGFEIYLGFRVSYLEFTKKSRIERGLFAVAPPTRQRRAARGIHHSQEYESKSESQ